MIVIIAGSRSITDYETMKDIILKSNVYISEIVSGCSRGVDSLAIKYAKENNIKLKEFPADWSKGKSAGYRRNLKMGKYAEFLIAIHDGESPGTQHMINIMKSLGKPYLVYEVKK